MSKKQQFGRIAEVICGRRILSSKDLRIEFRIDFDDDPTPNTTEITIYNLSQTTLDIFKKNERVIVNAGYQSDNGVIFSGLITKVLTKRNGTDHATVISLIDSQDLDSEKTVSKSYRKGISASAILEDLAKILGIKLMALSLATNKTYKTGYSINGSIIEEMKRISKDCGASMYISRGNLYIRSNKEGDNTSFILSSDTGLIGSPEPFEEETDDNKGRRGYKVKSLLQYRMNTASIINITSLYVNGKFRVKKGTHTWNGDDFYTEVEVE